MSQSVFNWCKRNYPKTMTIEQVDSLHDAGKLTDDEYNEVITI